MKLKNLTGYTTYMISVAVFNAAGDGPRSLPTRGRTQQAGDPLDTSPCKIHQSTTNDVTFMLNPLSLKCFGRIYYIFDPTVFPKLPAEKVINFQLDGSHHTDCMSAVVLDCEGDGLSLSIGGSV